jgi:threonine dehydratase
VQARVSLDDIRAAAQRIRPIARRTPVLRSDRFDEAAGISVLFKCENLQVGGAFKIRGAANFIFSLAETKPPKHVVAYSSGNHAQAVAIAARAVGAKATVVMPVDAPRSKMEATRGQGAEIINYDRHRESRETIAQRVAAETGAVTVPPFDHPWIAAGQGTTALELLEDHPDLESLITPVGGGGLLAGCATAAKSMKPAIRVFGAEPEIANDWYLSMAAGRQVEISTPSTIADGLRSTKPGDVTFPIVRENVEQILLVTEDEIKSAVKFLLEHLKLLVEPSGAAAAAAVLYRKLPPGPRTVGVVLSGGNMDLDQLAAF